MVFFRIRAAIIQGVVVPEGDHSQRERLQTYSSGVRPRLSDKNFVTTTRSYKMIMIDNVDVVPTDTQESPHRDAEEELNVHPSQKEMYDVVICGTDLIQSILSSALSRAGKKVLHCDGNEWYGGLDAVLHVGSTLESFIEECQRFARSLVQEGVYEEWRGNGDYVDSFRLPLLPQEKQGNLRLHSQTFISASIDTEATEGSVDKPCFTEDSQEAIQESTHDFEKITSVDKTTESSSDNETKQPTATAPPLERGFCFDLTPMLLYASGDAVDGLVKSGVSEYLEFKSLKGLYLLTDEENSKGRNGRASAGKKSQNHDNDKSDGDDICANNDKGLSIFRVPCSKGDVFCSELLSPVDKRRLMKFLQLIIDYGVATQLGDDKTSNNPIENDDHDGAEDNLINYPVLASGEDTIKSVNERHLHRGRALSRPQNKAMPSSTEMDALLRSIRDNMSFSDYLTQVAKLPARLSTVVSYALALSTFGSSGCDKTRKGNDSKNQTSLYSAKDGIDDLVRHLSAIGRFGDTAFLVPMYGSGELSQAFCRSGAVYGSTYMLRRSPFSISLDGDSRVQGIDLKGEQHIGGKYNDLDTDDVSDKTIPCKHVIVPSTMIASTKCCKTRIYRRISILQGKLMLDRDQNDTKNGSDTDQRYAIIIPPGTNGLGNISAIHGVAVDDSAFVAPPGLNYTVLHLSTSSQDEDDDVDELSLNVLSKAVNCLITSRSTKDGSPCQECHYISFSYSINATRFSGDDRVNSGQPFGLHVCYRGEQSLTVDSAFREARRVFEDICPDADFLALAKQVEDKVVYRDSHDDDDEKDVLDSACTMIQASTKENFQTEGNVV